MTPEKLGPYLVEGILGKGGMGTVYRGVDPDNSEVVALKVLSPELSEDLAFLQRFQEEVETLLELRHPNIVQLLSFGRQDDMFYFAMELVEGKSLYAMQKSGHHFLPAEAVAIAIDVCEGLRHSHNLGIVHRDLKPGNIIRSDKGEIKLADYGIAKRFGGAQMTSSGVLGTAEFMAPEQARGKPASIQSDLYSLGAVIFALLAGRPPFEEATPYKTLEKVVTATPPILSHVVGGVPDQLSNIVDKLLRKKPEERFRSAQSVQTKLREVLEAMHEHAEMETSVVDDFTVSPDGQSPAKNNLDKSARTIVDSAAVPADAMTVQQTGVAGETKNYVAGVPKKSSVSPSAATIQEGTTLAGGGSANNRMIREKDFHERAVLGDHYEEPTESSSNFVTILLGVGFLMVLLASGFLIWDRVVRPRTPEELWQRIEPEQNRPQLVLDDIQKFIELYPEDERIDQIEKLGRQAEANQYRNRLGLRPGLGTTLLDIEKKFLKYTNSESGTEFERARLLDSLITFFQAGDSVDERTEECLKAAAVFRDSYLEVSGDEVEVKRAEIIQRIQAAKDLEAEGNTEQARAIQRALVDLFKDKIWADDLIEPVRRDLLLNDSEN